MTVEPLSSRKVLGVAKATLLEGRAPEAFRSGLTVVSILDAYSSSE